MRVSVTVLFVFICGCDPQLPEGAPPLTPIARGKADSTIPHQLTSVLAATAGIDGLGRCDEIRVAQASPQGLTFAVHTEGGLLFNAPDATTPKLSHWATVLEPNWWRDRREVRLDYEYVSGTYTVGVGPFAREAEVYRYVRLAFEFDDQDLLDDVVYTVWSWESSTILPYAMEYEHSCRRGTVFSR